MFEVITDWLVIISITSMLGAVYISWLMSYRTPRTELFGSSRWFSLPVWAQIAVGFGITLLGGYFCYLLWIPIPLTLSAELSLVLRIAGLLMSAVGVALWFWSRWALGAMMGVSTSSGVQLRQNHQLVRHGPYAFVRHPMYLSYELLLFGLFVMYHTWTPLLILLLAVVVFLRRARREEQALADAFGDNWRAYVQQVPMFVPRFLRK